MCGLLKSGREKRRRALVKEKRYVSKRTDIPCSHGSGPPSRKRLRRKKAEHRSSEGRRRREGTLGGERVNDLLGPIEGNEVKSYFEQKRKR